ncbi:MAG: hypothetical protein JNL12_03305 [Planctomycetes bacterium]|nr:hypothetical protein [Planctomycetota bacterium]
MHGENDGACARAEERAQPARTAAKPRPTLAKNGAPSDPATRASWRTFQQLGSVGPATAGDLVLLGFRTIDELRGQDARVLYERMGAETGSRQDPCVEDVFRCAIAQAEHPDLPERLRQWHHWTPLRGEPPGTMPSAEPRGDAPALRRPAGRATASRPASSRRPR